MNVCGKCDVFMVSAINGIRVREMIESGPYRVWAADLWRCPVCKWELVTGFGNGPLAYPEDPSGNYEAYVQAAGERGELVTAHHVKGAREAVRF